jgi:hypothetical protein
MNLLMFVGGLVLLILGANALVRGASKLALSFGISPLVVGLTIVAFGTSAPEMAVSVGAVLDGLPALALLFVHVGPVLGRARETDVVRHRDRTRVQPVALADSGQIVQVSVLVVIDEEEVKSAGVQPVLGFQHG